MVRLPDLYNRMHAASKCVTLGIAGLLIAAGLSVSALPDADPVKTIVKVSLVLLFQFIAAPVGAHLLSKAALADHADLHPATISDNLEQDGSAPNTPSASNDQGTANRVPGDGESAAS